MTRNPLGNLDCYNVLLASHSPRRRELLGMLGVKFSIATPVEVDESYPADIPTEGVALYLSKKKSSAYLPGMAANDIVITADTVVICEGKILGKPSSAEDAREMLRMLSGRTHKVITGVTVATSSDSISFSAETEVEFAPLDDNEIDFYIERFSPMDKAGAYGIQEWIGATAIKNIKGSYYNVMGLPIHRLYTILKTL